MHRSSAIKARGHLQRAHVIFGYGEKQNSKNSVGFGVLDLGSRFTFVEATEDLLKCSRGRLLSDPDASRWEVTPTPEETELSEQYSMQDASDIEAFYISRFML